MGRKKVELKRIDDKSRRQVTFSKRRSGLIKKASVLSVLCDVEVALVVFSGRGRLYDFCSANSLLKVLERYQSHLEEEEEEEASKSKAQVSLSEYSNLKSHAELLEIVRSHLEVPNAQQLGITDLVQLEEQLDAALSRTRSRKTQLMLESVTALHVKERKLREENKLLEKQIAEIENEEDNSNLAVAATRNNGCAIHKAGIGFCQLANNHAAHPTPRTFLRLL